jgi:hypothetical protein
MTLGLGNGGAGMAGLVAVVVYLRLGTATASGVVGTVY